MVIAFYYVRNVLPLAALFYATALIADEVEGRTITYLLTRPMPRAGHPGGEVRGLPGHDAVSMALPAVVVTFFLLTTIRGWTGVGRARARPVPRHGGGGAHPRDLRRVLHAAWACCCGGPVIPGLLFLFVWELLANAPGYLPRFTITAYLRSLIHHRPPDEGMAEIFGQVLPTALCLEAVGAMIVVFLAVAGLDLFHARVRTGSIGEVCQ